jgi:hypothetical protein
MPMDSNKFKCRLNLINNLCMTARENTSGFGEVYTRMQSNLQAMLNKWSIYDKNKSEVTD